MTINERLKSVRKELKINQKDFANSLGFKQSYYSYVEGGKKSVTSKLLEALQDKYSISIDWMYTGKGEQYMTKGHKNITPNNVPSVSTSDEKAKYSYMQRFRQQLLKDNSELAVLSNDVFEVLGMDEVIRSLHDTKIGDVLFFGIENMKKASSFKEFKEIGLQVLNDALPYATIVHEFAEACRKFVKELSQVKDEINMDFDFEDYFWQADNETK